MRGFIPRPRAHGSTADQGRSWIATHGRRRGAAESRPQTVGAGTQPHGKPLRAIVLALIISAGLWVLLLHFVFV